MEPKTEPQATRDVSPERKAAYYAGGALQAVGLLLFLSVFLSGALSLRENWSFDEHVPSMVFRAIAGMLLGLVGGMLRRVGARGLAGSGVVLDPERARRDLAPYGRMAGGLAKDAIDEAGVSLASRPAEVVKIRCRACGTLNEEDSKFCRECGQAI